MAGSLPPTGYENSECPGESTDSKFPGHNFIRVTKSSWRPAPYLKCSKCGEVREC